MSSRHKTTHCRRRSYHPLQLRCRHSPGRGLPPSASLPALSFLMLLATITVFFFVGITTLVAWQTLGFRDTVPGALLMVGAGLMVFDLIGGWLR